MPTKVRLSSAQMRHYKRLISLGTPTPDQTQVIAPANIIGSGNGSYVAMNKRLESKGLVKLCEDKVIITLGLLV
jgi:hypothetical protein